MWIFSKKLQFFHLVSLLQEMWLFNNSMHQKEIHWMHILWQRQRRKHQYPKLRKSHNISRDFHLHYSPQHVPVSLNGQVAELLCVPGVFLAVTTTGISLSRKCDVTKCRSRPWVVTRERSVLVESFLTSLALNLSPSRFIVLDIVLNCLDIWTVCITACSMPTAR